MKQRNLLTVLFLSLITLASNAQFTYSDSTIKAQWETDDNHFHGKYESWYPNGQKKAEGNFEHNLRSGTWKVWDEDGNLRVQRDYQTPIQFERVVPPVPKNKLVKLVGTPVWEPWDNDEGVEWYYPLQESEVIWSKRIWRRVEPRANEVLFADDLLFNKLREENEKGNITAYLPKDGDDEFRYPATDPIDWSNLEIAYYKIKEDHFFDRNRLVSETRIIGICPVVVGENELQTRDLAWFYYPAIRSSLVQATISAPNKYPVVEHFDDLFRQRCFTGLIYKESNVFDRELPKSGIDSEALKVSLGIDVGMIESEHDIWISYTKKP